MNTYDVTLSGIWYYTKKIEAKDSEEAYELAYSNFLCDPKPDVELSLDSFNHFEELL